MTAPLHVFEPRYRAMVADAMKGDGIIGMIVLKPGFESDYEGRPPIYPIGTAGEIVDIEQLPDGRFNIWLQAMTKFRVTSEDQSRAYRLARVEAVPEVQGRGELPLAPAERQRLLDALRSFTDRPEFEIPTSIPETELVNTLSRRLPLEPAERQLLLEQDGIDRRLEKLIDLLGTKSGQR
jgi:Lon protease-like protein